MNTTDIVRKVLDKYVDSQINIDSETARDILAKDIAEQIDNHKDFWDNLDQGQTYKANFVDDDLHI